MDRKKTPGSRLEPEIGIANPAFTYTSSVNTDIRRLFAKHGFKPPSEHKVIKIEQFRKAKPK